MKTIDPDPVNNDTNDEEVPLDETDAEHTGSNNTDEDSEGRKEGKSFYEKVRELKDQGSENQKK